MFYDNGRTSHTQKNVDFFPPFRAATTLYTSAIPDRSRFIYTRRERNKVFLRPAHRPHISVVI